MKIIIATLLLIALPALGAGDPNTYEGRVEIAVAKAVATVAAETDNGTAAQLERTKLAQSWASSPSAAANLIPAVRAITAATDQASIDAAVAAILANTVKLKLRAEAPTPTPTPAPSLIPPIQKACITWAKAVSAAASPTDAEKTTAQAIFADPKGFAARIEALVVEQDATLVPASTPTKFRTAVDAVLSASAAVAKPASAAPAIK